MPELVPELELVLGLELAAAELGPVPSCCSAPVVVSLGKRNFVGSSVAVELLLAWQVPSLRNHSAKCCCFAWCLHLTRTFEYSFVVFLPRPLAILFSFTPYCFLHHSALVLFKLVPSNVFFPLNSVPLETKTSLLFLLPLPWCLRFYLPCPSTKFLSFLFDCLLRLLTQVYPFSLPLNVVMTTERSLSRNHSLSIICTRPYDVMIECYFLDKYVYVRSQDSKPKIRSDLYDFLDVLSAGKTQKSLLGCLGRAVGTTSMYQSRCLSRRLPDRFVFCSSTT